MIDTTSHGAFVWGKNLKREQDSPAVLLQNATFPIVIEWWQLRDPALPLEVP